MTFEGAKLLAASTRAVEWYKSHAHILFLSEVISNSYVGQLNVNEVYSYHPKIRSYYSVFLQCVAITCLEMITADHYALAMHKLFI